MADLRDHAEEIESTGAGIVALSVDEPARSAALRQWLGLPYPILCDTRREVVKSWGLHNPRGPGGIAVPATFLIDRNRRLLFASVGGSTSRVSASDLVVFLRADAAVRQEPRRSLLLPSPMDIIRAMVSSLRYGMKSPNR